jgi:hypothetical protein
MIILLIYYIQGQLINIYSKKDTKTPPTKTLECTQMVSSR